MSKHTKKLAFNVAVTIFFAVSGGRADAEEVNQPSTASGLSVTAELSSIYNYRGANTFMKDSMADQNGLFAPGLSWTIFDTGLSIGYWSAYQINGSNTTEIIDVGLGCEQDLYFSYVKELIPDTLSFQASLTYIFYPFADKDTAGVVNPSYLEPLISLQYSGPLDVGLSLSYFAALQDAIKLYRYLYVNPSIGKSVELGGRYSTAFVLGFGYKLFNERHEMKNNVFDVRFDWSFPIKLTEVFYIEPGVHLSWTNIEEKAVLIQDSNGVDQETMVDATAGDGFMVYASLLVGADF